MSDLISRQAAIDAVKEYFMFSPREGRECAKAIERVPSVQPRKGKISYTEFCEEFWGASAICDLCGCSWQVEDGNDNFCPNCGADMREGDTDD